MEHKTLSIILIIYWMDLNLAVAGSRPHRQGSSYTNTNHNRNGKISGQPHYRHRPTHIHTNHPPTATVLHVEPMGRNSDQYSHFPKYYPTAWSDPRGATKLQPHPQGFKNDPLTAAPTPTKRWESDTIPEGSQQVVVISSLEQKQSHHHPSPLELQSQTLPRRPGLPNDIPLPSINMSNVLTLLELASSDPPLDPGDLSFQQQALILQTLFEVGNFIGIQDIRDWLGIIIMFFISGPVLIPMFWMPIMLIILAAFMIPVVINGAGVAAAVAATQGVGVIGRGSRGRGRRGLTLPLESYCLEMLSCEATNFLRSSKWSNWVTRAFRLTSVEWAGPLGKGQGQSGGSYFSQEEDCSKYRCKIVTPLQNFLSNWYSYLFTFQQGPTPPSSKNSTDSYPTSNSTSTPSTPIATSTSILSAKRKRIRNEMGGGTN